MKKIICLSILFLSMAMPVFADTVYPPNARYVIVNPNSRLKASTTFLLDTKTGRTWQFVEDSSGITSWSLLKHDYFKPDGTYAGTTYDKAPVTTSP